METIFSMVLVSICPYPVKKIFLVLITWILFSTICFAHSVYLTVSSTPYDKQMMRIRAILFCKNDAGKQNLSLVLVNHWMEDIRAIPYGYSPEWKTPAEVELSPAADCKGKAVALYQLMQSHGADHVRLVIGKRTTISRKTHAWVEWSTEAGTYILDPTINWAVCRADQLGNSSYIPFYAYAGARKYRVITSTLYAAN
jgi:predicted transglutaminase-like cysteine proteinase